MKNLFIPLGQSVRHLVRKSLPVLAAVSVAGCLASRVSAQVTPTTLYAITNFPATVAPSSISTTTNIIPLTKYCVGSLQGVFNVSSGTGNIVVQGSFSSDSTNFATTPWTWIIPANGTNRVVANTNWSAAALAGYSAINIYNLTNQNSGTLTNFGFVFNRAGISSPTY